MDAGRVRKEKRMGLEPEIVIDQQRNEQQRQVND
ncbi:MAG: hypothetical protein V7642_61, partial [Burkholderiales bacterium]